LQRSKTSGHHIKSPETLHPGAIEYNMRVMTFNLRFENDRDGSNAWSLRREMVVAIIESYSPSILGTQEGTCSQIDYLQDHLQDYYLHTPHRVFDDTCQYPTLFVRKDEFDVAGGAEFWLSKTPEVHRSMDWDSAFPRLISYARLRTVTTNQVLCVAVTHLDHIGNRARYEQGKIIAAWLQQQSEPVIIMGDFNESPELTVHQVLTAPETGLQDTWQILGHKENTDSFTYHGFQGIPRKTRMDWILVSSDFRVIDAQVVKDHSNGRYPSDHFPYMAELELV
jgi:endonuclease/exonuclease/phosphatase family metal-dependent hydrolase